MKTINKKTGILAILTLCSMFAFGQNVKTKTITISPGVTKTYSYYLDKEGNEVLHGKFSYIDNINIEEQRVDNSIHGRGYIRVKDNFVITCNYKDGKVHGILNFKRNDKSWFAPIWRKSDGSLDWKETTFPESNTTFSVNVYEGVLDGDINITYGGYIYKGKANKGILVNGTEFVISHLLRNGVLINGKNYEQTATYKNFKPVSPESNLQPIMTIDELGRKQGEFINIEAMIFIQLPFYVNKDYDKLNNIPEYQNVLKNENFEYLNAKNTFDEIKNQYNISETDKTFLDRKLEEMNNQAKQKVEEKKKQEKLDYENKINDIQKKQNLKNIFLQLPCDINKDIYQTGNCKKMCYEDCTLNLLKNRYKELLMANKPEKPKSLYLGMSSKEFLYYNEYALLGERERKEIDAYYDIMLNSYRPYLENLNKLGEKINIVIEKVNNIHSIYVKCTEDYYHKPITKISKKILYNAYIDITKYYLEKSKTASISELEKIFTEFDIICSKMLSTETSNLEKQLKKATTTEEKLAIFLN